MTMALAPLIEEQRPTHLRRTLPARPVGREAPLPPAVELSIVMPCLNEAATVAICVAKALGFLQRAGIAGEVVVADNGSTDGSVELAEAAGARIVRAGARGYGSALRAGIAACRGRFVVMGDSDDSYDFTALDGMVAALREGHQLVMGNRFAGGIAPGAMPPLHRYLGNPVLSFVGRLLFRCRIRDFHCGLRGFDRQAVMALGLTSSGMEFASEMVVKASLAGLRITEVPTTLSRDGRDRPPHLRSWRDGWRHLRFLLLMSPAWLLLYPGAVLFAVGAAAQLATLSGVVHVKGVGFDIHTMLYAAGAGILGLQLMLFSVIARAIGLVKRLLPMTVRFERLLTIFTLERGILVGTAAAAFGFVQAARMVWHWYGSGLSVLEPSVAMRTAIPAVSLMVMGAEIVFASFVLSFIDPQPQAADGSGGRASP